MLMVFPLAAGVELAVVLKLQVLGVHPVDEAPDPCHLIELTLEGTGDPLDLRGVTQERAGMPGADWQTPFDEHLLDPAGTSGRSLGVDQARAVASPARLAFFFHFLRLDRPLLTPAGPLRLPPASPRPDRLAFLKYRLF
jgi:hypothetical protein